MRRSQVRLLFPAPCFPSAYKSVICDPLRYTCGVHLEALRYARRTSIGSFGARYCANSLQPVSSTLSISAAIVLMANRTVPAEAPTCQLASGICVAVLLMWSFFR